VKNVTKVRFSFSNENGNTDADREVQLGEILFFGPKTEEEEPVAREI